MQEIKLLIEKFWAGTATEAEKKRLFELIHEQGGEWQQVLEKEYRQEVAGRPSFLMPGRSEEMLEKLHEQIAGLEEEPAQARRRMLSIHSWRRWAAAAVFAGGLVIGIYRLTHHAGASGAIALQEGKSIPSSRHLYNKGTAVQYAALPDGSVVSMYPGAGVSYDSGFGRLSRQVSLKGKAIFDVAKKAGAPFMVTAEGFTTTALGTKFMVNTEDVFRLSVVLLEGKVSVHGMTAGRVEMKDIYLTPGQELAVDLHTGGYAVDKWRMEDSNSMAGSAGNGLRKSPRKAAPAYVFVFERTSLEKVFRQLSEHYKVDIQVRDTDLTGLSFTGKILSTDDLQTVLSIICNTNDLTFSQENGKIKISKQK